MKTKYYHFNNMRLYKTGFIALIVIMLPALFLAGCKKNNDAGFNKATSTLFQYINDNKQLTLYRAALKRAGIDNAEMFSSGGPLTVFAPVDSAFIKAGLTLDSINKYDPQTLSGVLKYGMVYGKVSSGSLVGFYQQDAASKNGTYKPRVNKNYYGIFFDGISLINGGSTDLNDGVLHELNRVPLPPTTNVFATISKTPDLTIYTAILKRIGQDGALSVPPPINPNNPDYSDLGLYYTVFAPTNDAFKTFGYPDIQSVENTDVSVLQQLIVRDTYLRQGKLLTSVFKGGYNLSSGSGFYVEADGFAIFTAGNLSLTHIIRPDIIATNGIVQVIDQVMVAR
ncbi:fasciclin domain-containing protein [Pedobacter psychrodurus]|uniref:fasciclin domain-containing protein n=1 Tax=Pedobacter psychrodurus TaxID=2530456 RepID=UPI00292D3627|nr:fasciclin domain-containing protein [Pedobacter psychrodurus]